MRRKMRCRFKMTNAYLTVEAALVMPIVLAVILLVVYLLFFQYDRCLLEQNTGILALRGCTFQIVEREEMAARIIAQSERRDERFLAWAMEEVKVLIQGNRVRVERSGMLEFPFKGLRLWRGDTVWQSYAAYENYRIQPVNFIRNCRKVMGGK